MRALAVATALILAALAAGAAVRAPWAVAVLFAAVIVSVSTNGLAFTAVAEHAGSSWAGRALGSRTPARMRSRPPRRRSWPR